MSSGEPEEPRQEEGAAPSQRPHVGQHHPSAVRQSPIVEPEPAHDPGLLSGPGSSRSAASQALRQGGIRNLNINLLTQFPRKTALADQLGALTGKIPVKVIAGAALVLAVGVIIALAVLGWWCWATVVLVAAVAFLAVTMLVPVPGSGSFLQWVKFQGASRAHVLDMFTAFHRARWWVKLVPAVILVVAGVLSTVICVAVGAVLGQVIAGVVAALVLVVGTFAFLVLLDWLARDLAGHRFWPLPGQIHRLSMVHALSWTTLATFPGEGKQAYRPLLFVSSFNEAFDGYVGGFVEGLGAGLEVPWGLSPNFPDVKDGFRPFLEYVERTEAELHHSFSAYPHLNADDVRSTLHLDRSLRSLLLQHDDPPPQAGRIDQFLSEIQQSIASVPDSPSGLGVVPDAPGSTAFRPENPFGRSIDVSAEHEILIVVVPFDKDGAQEGINAILNLPGGEPAIGGSLAAEDSPFRDVEGTHFARMSVVTEMHYEPPAPADAVGLGDRAWFVLAAHIDVGRAPRTDRWSDTWAGACWDALAAENFDWGWMKAAKPADRQQFVNMVHDHRREPIVEQIDHPAASTWQVLRAVETARQLAAALPNLPPTIPDFDHA